MGFERILARTSRRTSIEDVTIENLPSVGRYQLLRSLIISIAEAVKLA